MNTLKFEKKNVKMVAHRGLSGLEKENSTLAFVAACNRSYYGIETDVHCTSDGNFIVIHDDVTTRVTGVERVVEETDFATLRTMRLLDIDGSAGREDLCMPTLEEYIRICKKYEKTCVLELKNHMPEFQIHRIIDFIESEEYLEHVIFISFKFENLVCVRQYRPEQAVQFLFKAFTDEIVEKVRTHRFDVDVDYHALTPEMIRLMHSFGVLVNCWTVNDPAVGESLAEMGVDFITTNILE